MELWLRSQDRLSLVKPIDLELMPCRYTPNADKETSDIRAYLSKQEDDYIILGTYTSKKRALEILNEIQNGENTVRTKIGLVYEMPKE